MDTVTVPPQRLGRWLENFTARHGATVLSVGHGALSGIAADGSEFTARLPFSTAYDGAPGVGQFVEACAPPTDWGVLLVRKGGFAVARMEGSDVVESKVGRRHVQGRTKAGGQSQQRFARRRDNQAKAAYAAAADHAARILAGTHQVVLGGDRSAVDEVLADRRLGHLTPIGNFDPVPDPRRDILESAVARACSAIMTVVNT